jgi:hypothetical protein
MITTFWHEINHSTYIKTPTMGMASQEISVDLDQMSHLISSPCSE